jgi:nucleoside-diphosphate-sugar epimerase
MTDASSSVRACRALVTGGAGAVGSHLVDVLVASGAAEVRVLDLPDAEWARNLSDASACGRVTAIKADVRDRVAVETAMQGVDLVFHEAALRVTQCVEEPRLAHEVMADGTFHVVDAAARAGVARVVVASSAVLYGPDPSEDVGEIERTDRADTLYGSLKAYNEALLRCYEVTHGLRSVALRYFNVYGPRMNIRGPHTEVLVRWMERIDRGDPPLIDGDGMQLLDFVYVTDVARANVLAATTTSPDRVFNVGSGEALTLNELAATLLRVMDSDLAVRRGPPRTINAARRRVADPTHAERGLGFRVQVSLEDGLRALVAWWRGASTAPAL